MLIEHLKKRPQIHESVYVAPNAVIGGDVTICENSRVLFGIFLILKSSKVDKK
jgi:carbonic anhydrase/acetyltransferase-like protein (isoleucine patch superfamily)